MLPVPALVLSFLALSVPVHHVLTLPCGLKEKEGIHCNMLLRAVSCVSYTLLLFQPIGELGVHGS